MPRRITAGDLTGLKPQYATFVIEYMKDYAPRRAAEAAGYAPETGYQLLEREEIQRAVNYMIQRRQEQSDIDAEWVLMEFADNHRIARQQGKISASNQALMAIGKHSQVNAFAPEQVNLVTDEQVMQRLQRARKRMAQPPSEPEVSFL